MVFNPYVPAHVTQADGSPSQWTNRWAAVGAWLSRGATRTKRCPAPDRFRQWAAKPEYSTGGLADIQRGLQDKRLSTNATMLCNVQRAKIERRLMRRSGKLYAAETSFDVWPDKDNCQSDFAGYHMIGNRGGPR